MVAEAVSRAEAVRTSIETIDPHEARRLLRQNTHNRRLSEERVANMARDMRDGRWVLNGESLKISTSGKLLDGQHRLHAVVASGATIATIVVRGLPEETQETVDIGQSRQYKAVLQLRGATNSTIYASAARLLWFFDRYGVPSLADGRVVAATAPTHAELDATLEAHPGLAGSVPFAALLRKSAVRYTPSYATVLHYLTAQKDRLRADEFWSQLASGEIPYETTPPPVFVLRETLLRDVVAPHRMAPVYRAAISIKAWNAERLGETIKLLGWRRGGEGSEKFPTIV